MADYPTTEGITWRSSVDDDGLLHILPVFEFTAKEQARWERTQQAAREILGTESVLQMIGRE
jgi:hypothetical protein